MMVVIGLCTLIPLGVRMVLTLENTNKKEKISFFVWYFAHLIVSLHSKTEIVDVI